jgi:sec-independent protein translocase protein TatA
MWPPGPLELLIVLVIVLIIFGGRRLPELGRSLGSGMREFKDSITGKGGQDSEEREEAAQLPRAADQAAASAPEAEPVEAKDKDAAQAAEDRSST